MPLEQLEDPYFNEIFEYIIRRVYFKSKGSMRAREAKYWSKISPVLLAFIVTTVCLYPEFRHRVLPSRLGGRCKNVSRNGSRVFESRMTTSYLSGLRHTLCI